MDTNPESKWEKFLELVFLRKNKLGMVEVNRFHAFEEDPDRGYLNFESRPDDEDMWELVYYRDDPEHFRVTLARFTTERLSEMEKTKIARRLSEIEGAGIVL
jgi:hypothetical protein